MGYDRIILEENQELIMSRDNDNKYDNNATVVKTVDGFIVGRVPKKFTQSCRVMMDTIDVLSINLSVSFIKLNGTEVREKTGKRYWEDQPEIRVDFLTEEKKINKIRERLLHISKQWKGIEFIEVEEETEKVIEEPRLKRGDHVGFGDIVGEEDDELEGDELLGLQNKRFKSEQK